MLQFALPAHHRFGSASRLPVLSGGEKTRAGRELLILITAGAMAAVAVAFVPSPWRIPGHAILKASFPIVLGIAVVPRHFAGTVAGIAAAATAGLLVVMGAGHLQAAAVTGVLAIGPAIDLAMIGARAKGPSLYLRFATAGLLANLLAFAVRWAVAWPALDGARPHMMAHIGLPALVSFAACGLVAGLVSAVMCFRNSPREQ